MNNIAIITGATGGFGREFIKLILQKENLDEIWAIARNNDKLLNLVNEFGDKIKIFSYDLSNLDCIKNFQTKLNSEIKIKYLINNAGYAKFCSYEDLDINDSLNMINLNISSVVAMGLACIPYMDKDSRIINISSQSSFLPLPYLNIYSATKVFVRHYSRALNVELKDKKITVTTVCPGWMKTNLYDAAKVDNAKKVVNSFDGITTPDKVAKKALEDADKGKALSIYGFFSNATHIAGKILPQSLLMKLWTISQKL
jgi:short-subunit dehydrogenase